MSTQNPPSTKLDTIKFNVFSLKLNPFAGYAADYTTNGMLKSVFKHVDDERKEGRAVVIDRNANKKGEEERSMFLVSSARSHPENCYKCSLALLKPSRKFKVKKAGEITLADYSTSIGEIAVETHFFVNYTKENAIICVEFNSDGPRYSDIEYYLLNVSKGAPLQHAKSAKSTCFMTNSVEKTLAELKDVMSIEMRIKPANLYQLEPSLQADYFDGMNKLNRRIHPSWIKLQASFAAPGKRVKSKEIDNPDARNMATRLISVFKEAREDLDVFDSFEVVYKDHSGGDGFFNLLSNKVTFEVEADWSTLKKPMDWYALIKQEFEQFVATL